MVSIHDKYRLQNDINQKRKISISKQKYPTSSERSVFIDVSKRKEPNLGIIATLNRIVKLKRI